MNQSVYLHNRDVLILNEFHANIHIGISLTTQGYLTLAEFINPSEFGPLLSHDTMEVQLRYGSHLGIYEGVPEQKFL